MDSIVRAPCQLCGEDRPVYTLVALPTNIVNYIGSRNLPR